MAFILADRVKETTITTGTSNLALGGAFGGFRTFSSAIGNGNSTYYGIETSDGNYEVGVGTYTSASNTLSRDTVISSSNSGSKISLTGVSTVFVTQPGTKALFVNPDSYASGVGFTGYAFPDGTVQATSATDGAAPAKLRRSNAGVFFQYFVDNGNDRTVALHMENEELTPQWKIGLKDSPSSQTEAPSYGYVFGENGSAGAYADANNAIYINTNNGFWVVHESASVFNVDKSDGSIFKNGTASTPTLTVRGAAAQSAKLQQWETSAESVVASVDNAGKLICQTLEFGDGTTQSTAAYTGTGELYVDQYIYHNGDTNTYIRFRGDQLDFVAGGRTMLTLDEASNDKVTVNDGGNDVDFQVEGQNDANLIRTDAANDRVGIGTDSPDYLLDIDGTARVTTLRFTDGTSQTTAGSYSHWRLSDDSSGPFNISDNEELKIAGGDNVTTSYDGTYKTLTITATDTNTTYTAGNGLILAGTEFSAPDVATASGALRQDITSNTAAVSASGYKISGVLQPQITSKISSSVFYNSGQKYLDERSLLTPLSSFYASGQQHIEKRADISGNLQAQIDGISAASEVYNVASGVIVDNNLYAISGNGGLLDNWNYASGISVSGAISASGYAISGALQAQLANRSNWDTAYGWGNHASAGYLTSQTSHTDVVVDGDFSSEGLMKRGGSAGSYSIVTDNSSNWNTAHGWGNHASAGYLTSETWNYASGVSVSGAISASGYAISGALQAQLANKSNWDTAYGWGNHASASYLTSETWNYASGVSVSGAISASGYAISGALQAQLANRSNWDTAYGWGNHASAGYISATLTTEQVQDIVGAMFSGNTETNITATYEDGDGTIDLVSTNTQLSTEEVQDIVGAMFSGNTETDITATYQDGDGTIDLAATNTTYSAGNGIALSSTTFSVSAGNGLAQDSDGLKLDDPANLTELTEDTDHTSDKILLWDEDASTWKYMTLDNLQDSIDTTGGGGGGGSVTTVKANGSQVGGADIVTLDFSSDFTVGETPDTEINISITKGISDGNFLTANDAVADDDFLRINGTEVEGLTAAEVRTALNVEDGADVTDATNVTAAGALMDSELTDLAGVKGVTISTLQVKPTEGAFANGDKTKLDSIEASADVTDTANVTSAGALMDSEVTNLAFVKALTKGISDGNVLTANDAVADDDFLRINGTEVEGLTAAEVRTALNVEDGADVTDATNVTAAGALMDSELTDLAGVKGVTISTLQVKPSEGAFADGDKTKLDAIEASADVTDATNVTAAGALMDSEVTNLAFVKGLTKGISDGNVLTANDAVADDDFLRINGTEVEGLTAAEVRTALNVEDGADVTDATNVTAAGALMDSELTDLAGVKGVTISTLQVKPTEGAFANGDKTKLDSIEASADVTDATNVTAAGALMDSEVTNLAFVKGLTKGISDGNVLTANDAVADDDFLRINGTEVEGLTAAEVRTALNVADGATAAGTVTAINNATANELVTIGSTTTELDAEANLTFDGSTLTVAGVTDITDTTDASDATGDTGALRCEGGASIAKKLYVGTDLDVDGTTNLDAVDIDGNVQIDGTLTVGVNDTGKDVKFFGATDGSYLEWDESEDRLNLVGGAYVNEAVPANDTATTATDTITIDASLGNYHNIVIGSHQVRTININNAKRGQRIILRLTQNGSSAKTVTAWVNDGGSDNVYYTGTSSATLKWAGGIKPTMSTGTGRTDVYGFLCTNAAGSAFDGFIIGQDIQ